MAAAPSSIPQVQPESKSAKKKKARSEAPAKASSALSDGDGAGQASIEATTNGADGVYESPYIKELYK